MVQSAARRNAASVQSFEVTVQSAVRDPVYLHMRILEWARSMEVCRRRVLFLLVPTLVAEHDDRAATGGIRRVCECADRHFAREAEDDAGAVSAVLVGDHRADTYV